MLTRRTNRWTVAAERVACSFTLVTVLPVILAAQIDSTEERAAGPKYETFGIREFFFGAHYRKAWATSVSAPVLDLNTYAGGIKPVRRGGGFQTKTLRFVASDDTEYTFRSIDKDPASLLPPELREGVARDILQDQISAQHPYAAVVVDSILRAVRVPHASPSLYLMPDDPALGEFRQEFAGMFGMLELRPDDGWVGGEYYAADRVIGSNRLFERVKEGPDDRANARGFLRARLVDVLVGDWDRHRDQWRWIRWREDEGGRQPREMLGDSLTGWYALPRDRDQAFVKYDGLLPSVAHFYVPQLVNFGGRYPRSMVGMHWNARELDRHFLTELAKPVWDSVVTEIIASLPDHVIDGAVKQLPPEAYALDGADIRSKLLARRDSLHRAATGLYEVVNERADVHGTDAAELAHVTGRQDGSVEVAIESLDNEGDPYFRRRFDAAVTKEIRIYLYGGNDHVLVQGEPMPMTVRLVGGPGDDEFTFESASKGVAVYDHEGNNRVVDRTGRARINRKAFDEWVYVESDPLPPRDWGKQTLPLVGFGASSDYGFLLGGGADLTWYGFRRRPYASVLNLWGAAATKAKFEVRVRSDIRFENSSVHTTLFAQASSLELLNFYGFGNNTVDPGGSDFFGVEQTNLTIEPLLAADLTAKGTFFVGPTLTYSNTGENEGTFIGTLPDLYGNESFWQFGARGRVTWSSRMNRGQPTFGSRRSKSQHGIDVEIDGWIYPKLLDVRSTFGALQGEVRGYVPLPGQQNILALRTGGRNIFGEAPYFDAAYIGGSGSLRGFPAERFAGDASLYGGGDLRLRIAKTRILMTDSFGILGLGDVGRVWVDGDSPGGWHFGYGGGIWFGILGPGNSLVFSYATSDETSAFYIHWGFHI